jgi:sugar lactone lactonase YvrE
VPETGALTFRVPSPFESYVKLHECHCDRQGRFWIGGFDQRFPADRNAEDAAICRLDGDRLTRVIDCISVANAMAFGPDGRTMYVADSPKRRVQAFDLDPATGDLSNGRVFLQLVEGEGFVDGATVDSEGGYWLANVAAGRLRRYMPDGSLERIVELPFSNPTKPAFGGPGLATLYVTSTKSVAQCFSRPSIENGAVFALEPGFTGVPEVPFAG